MCDSLPLSLRRVLLLWSRACVCGSRSVWHTQRRTNDARPAGGATSPARARSLSLYLDGCVDVVADVGLVGKGLVGYLGAAEGCLPSGGRGVPAACCLGAEGCLPPAVWGLGGLPSAEWRPLAQSVGRRARARVGPRDGVGWPSGLPYSTGGLGLEWRAVGGGEAEGVDVRHRTVLQGLSVKREAMCREGVAGSKTLTCPRAPPAPQPTASNPGYRAAVSRQHLEEALSMIARGEKQRSKKRTC